MSFLIGVIIFVVALLGSVMLHEAGHFATAKAFGMKATQFFVGFGSTIWSTKRGETEYGVKAVGVGLSDSNSTTIGVLPCVPAKQRASCASSDARSPAEAAGLRQGDKIVAIAGRPVSTWTQLGDAIKAQPAGRSVSFTVQRGNRRFTEQITLAGVSWRKGSYLGVQPVQLFARRGPINAV